MKKTKYHQTASISFLIICHVQRLRISKDTYNPPDYKRNLLYSRINEHLTRIINKYNLNKNP